MESEMMKNNGTRLLESWLTSVDYSVLDWVSIVVPPPVIATGIVCNPLAAGILARLPFPPADASAACYVIVLLIVSTIRLFAEGTLEWFAYVTSSAYIMHQADWICRLWKFLRTPALSTSSRSLDEELCRILKLAYTFTKVPVAFMRYFLSSLFFRDYRCKFYCEISSFVITKVPQSLCRRFLETVRCGYNVLLFKEVVFRVSGSSC